MLSGKKKAHEKYEFNMQLLLGLARPKAFPLQPSASFQTQVLFARLQAKLMETQLPSFHLQRGWLSTKASE